MITDSYKQLFLFFILLTLVSCRQQSESVAGVTTVRIEDFQDKVLETGDFLSDVRTLSLHDDSLGYIGQIKDVCAVDSFLYVLDGITASLTQFQIGAGKQMRSVCKRGNGPYEYIQPLALTADGPYLYVLDLPGMSVIAFDATLQGVKEISLPFPCMDFVKTDDGFLCYNAAPAEGMGRIVYMDEEGKVLNSFLPGKAGMSFPSGSKVFVKDARGRIFINLPFSRTIYQWDSTGKKPLEFLAFDFAGKNLPEDADLERMNVFEERYAITSSFFQVGDTSLYSFLYAQKRYYAVVSPAGVQMGSVPEDAACPFFPQWQAGDLLIGTYSAPFAGMTEDDGGEVLALFSLRR